MPSDKFFSEKHEDKYVFHFPEVQIYVVYEKTSSIESVSMVLSNTPLDKQRAHCNQAVKQTH